MPTEPDQFDPLPLLEQLADAEIDFVVIGGVAGGAQGSSYPTYDLDIAYARSRENIAKIIKVLRAVNAKPRGTDIGFKADATSIENGSQFTFATKYGDFDLFTDPAVVVPYAALRRAAERLEVSGREALFASLDHLIAMKEGSELTKDRLMRTECRVLSDVLRAPNGSLKAGQTPTSAATSSRRTR